MVFSTCPVVRMLTSIFPERGSVADCLRASRWSRDASSTSWRSTVWLNRNLAWASANLKKQPTKINNFCQKKDISAKTCKTLKAFSPKNLEFAKVKQPIWSKNVGVKTDFVQKLPQNFMFFQKLKSLNKFKKTWKSRNFLQKLEKVLPTGKCPQNLLNAT